MSTNPKSTISPGTAAHELSKSPPTPKDKAIIGNIEKGLGPVGPGKHEQVRTEALLRWLKKQDAKGSTAK